MQTKEINFSVRGIKPAPWANKEWDWRKAIATEAKKYSQAFSISKVFFEVKVVFYLLKSTFDRSDLDNLAKPVLDTLFLPNNPQVKDKTLTGVLVELDDSQVAKLYLEKIIVSNPQDEGADFFISWMEE